MIALEGKVKDNTIVVDNDITAYDGNAVIVTILDKPPASHRRDVDLRSFGHRTERGQHVDEYMHQMRDNDRI